VPCVFTDPSGKWRILTDSLGHISTSSRPYHILHHHYERAPHKAMSQGVDHYWAWCYRNECSECDSIIPDEIKGLVVLLSMKGD
jgi:hypothetical protein